MDTTRFLRKVIVSHARCQDMPFFGAGVATGHDLNSQGPRAELPVALIVRYIGLFKALSRGFKVNMHCHVPLASSSHATSMDRG